MKFSTPKTIVFFTALALAVIAFLDQLNLVPGMPQILGDQPFWLAFVAWGLLMLGNVSRAL